MIPYGAHIGTILVSSGASRYLTWLLSADCFGWCRYKRCVCMFYSRLSRYSCAGCALDGGGLLNSSSTFRVEQAKLSQHPLCCILLKACCLLRYIFLLSYCQSENWKYDYYVMIFSRVTNCSLPREVCFKVIQPSEDNRDGSGALQWCCPEMCEYLWIQLLSICTNTPSCLEENMLKLVEFFLCCNSTCYTLQY